MKSGKDMFRGSSILASYEGPKCFLTDCFEDEMDIIELGHGVAVAMINENDFEESFTLEVLRVRGNRSLSNWLYG
jgi:hypothetical protein